MTDMIRRGDLEAFMLGPRRTIVVRESSVTALAAEEQTLRPYAPE
ncbi:hypothetical protein [Tsukamurella strandjordii]|uniref:Uncharacterized protein n=1 Tax=Tsukamurella strandjordii TaxID=147577 RepID=A0AA90NCA7_9ACTN|nr:hypothetical protein [Tsukamurella strandjordii]MDP0399751.1 hypothetical protein [Tsukamurella strandjordii]